MEPTGEAKESDVKEQITILNGEPKRNSWRGSHKKKRIGETSLRTYTPHRVKGFKSVSFRTINSQIYM